MLTFFGKLVAYNFQDVVINFSLCLLLVMSGQMIGSVGSHYFLNESSTTVLLQKFTEADFFFKPACPRIEAATLVCQGDEVEASYAC